MTIGNDHFLVGVKKSLLAGGATLKDPVLLVIHFTAGMSAESSIDWWRNPGAKGASAHIIIDRDGTVIQCRALDKTCGHAGVSKWRGRSGCNAFSVGIELANAGDSVDGNPPKAFHKYPLVAGAIEAKHKNGGPLTAWERYPQPQLDSCFAVAKAIVDRYKMSDVVGHEDVAPARKNDPGPAFPMLELRQHCGFSGLPVVNR